MSFNGASKARGPTGSSIAQGAPLVGLGSNPAVEDHLLGHEDRRRHRDRRRRRHRRRTAAAPPHCWGPSCASSCGGLFLRYVEVAFWAAFACFLDSCAHLWCVGRVRWMPLVMGSVSDAFVSVCALRFACDCDFACCSMSASGARCGSGMMMMLKMWGLKASNPLHQPLG